MAGESRVTESPRLDAKLETPTQELRMKKRRVRLRRKSQEKFPRPLQIALLLGLPILLWTGIYLVARALL
ncbi:MAG: hypothetical protein ACKO01_09890 [Erythrobacter sp.]